MKIYYASRFVGHGVDRAVVIAADVESARNLVDKEKGADYNIEEVGSANADQTDGVLIRNSWVR